MHRFIVFFLMLMLALLAPLAFASAGDDARRAAAPTALPTPTFADQVVELTNVERLDHGGLPPLKGVDTLAAAAQGHSEAMAQRDFFMHCDPDTQKTPGDRMTNAGYTGWTTAAENIAAGYGTPAAVVAGWMNSAGHQDNILSANYSELGVGYAYQSDDQATVRQSLTGACPPDSSTNGPYGHYWTQNFGQRTDFYPVVINREAFYAGSINVALYVYGPAGATDMRFSNDAAIWSDWEPYSSAKSWVLAPGNGGKTVYSQVTAGASTYDYSDTIVLNAPAPVAAAVRMVVPGAPVTLAWDHATENMVYAIYRSEADPYFSAGDVSMQVGIVAAPGGAGAAVEFDDTSATDGGSYFYVTRATAGDGVTVADSNRVGRYVFALVPGN